MHPRAALRGALRDTLAAAPDLSGFTVIPAWAENVDPSALPAIGVFTPREQSRRSDVSGVLRITDVVIQVRRVGGDGLEDQLDMDSEALEALVLPVLAEVGSGEHHLETTDIEITAGGTQKIGSLNMLFRVGRFTSAGQSS